MCCGTHPSCTARWKLPVQRDAAGQAWTCSSHQRRPETVPSRLHCCSAPQPWQATLADADAPGHISNAEPFQQMHAHLEQSFPLVYQKLKHERVGGSCCSTSGCWVSPSALKAPAAMA